MKLFGGIILVLFYSIYLGKMILQKRKGIQTDQIAKGKQKDRMFYTELWMKIATYAVVAVEVVSIFVVEPQLPQVLIISGVVFGFVGTFIFALSVITMKDSWRAGIAEKDKTELITNGIYSMSRNPAFLGFDCVYVGFVLLFFNVPLLLFSVFAMVMLHLQVLQEEQYLPKVFGDDYIEYQHKVCRYFGRKQ